MNNSCECQCVELIEKLMRKIDKLENKEKRPKKVFALDTFEKAAKELSCSVSILRKAMENNILIEGIHYKYNGRRKYLFCANELQKIKGTL